MNIVEKIKERMNTLADLMESNRHLTHPEEVEAHIATISKFWSSLNDLDRDYINCARFAIEEKREWRV